MNSHESSQALINTPARHSGADSHILTHTSDAQMLPKTGLWKLVAAVN